MYMDRHSSGSKMTGHIPVSPSPPLPDSVLWSEPGSCCSGGGLWIDGCRERKRERERERDMGASCFLFLISLLLLLWRNSKLKMISCLW